jgi:hypothetical protein
MPIRDEEDTLELMRLLSNDICIDILRTIHGKRWCIASDVSRSLDIHTTTAQKYLSRMHEVGLLQRRVRVGKTRSTFEYIIDGPKIQFELDLNRLFQDNSALPKAVYMFYFSLFYAIVNGARKISGSQIDAMIDENIRRLKKKNQKEALLFLLCVERFSDAKSSFEYFQHNFLEDDGNTSTVRETYFQLIHGILGTYEAKMGKTATKNIVDASCCRIMKKNAALIEKYGLLEDIPKDYFDFAGGK